MVIREQASGWELLAFVHPMGDRQLVKGTIKTNETPLAAAHRELREESGIVVPSPMTSLGFTSIGSDGQRWHFFKSVSSGLPEVWQHETEDDSGHTFTFFWHPLNVPFYEVWHPVFHEAIAFVRPHLIRK